MKLYHVVYNRFAKDIGSFRENIASTVVDIGTITSLRFFENASNQDIVLEILANDSAKPKGQESTLIAVHRFELLEGEFNSFIKQAEDRGKQVKFVSALPLAGTPRALGIVVVADKVKASGGSAKETKRRKDSSTPTEPDAGSESSS